MNTKLEIAFFVLIGLFISISAIWMFKTEKRLKKFFIGKKAKDLEDTIVVLEEDISKLKKLFGLILFWFRLCMRIMR